MENAADRPELMFNTRFAGTTEITPALDGEFHGAREQYEDFRGVDPTVSPPNDWAAIPRHPNFGTFRIYYEGGTPAQRSAKILSDETDANEKFLRFSITEPNVVIEYPSGREIKARIQTELYGNKNLREFYQSVRIRLGPGFAKVSEMPEKVGWLCLAEFWNQPAWFNLPYPFRMSLSVVKKVADVGAPLFFKTQAQVLVTAPSGGGFKDCWIHYDDSFPVPIGEWMTVETYYLEGDKNTGRYYVAVTPADGIRRELFDVRDCTRHPDNPAPTGTTHYSPLKLYTSANLVNFVAARGEALEIDWADFSLWKNKRP